MQLLDPEDFLPEGTGSVVSVGNFDGVHMGHRSLIEEVVRRARKRGCSSVLVTFEPHPRLVLNPEMKFEVLTTPEEKMRLFKDFGVDFILCMPFTTELSRHSPEDFIESVIVRRLHTVEWIMGEDHGIGKDRVGKKNFLHTLLGKYHIDRFTADLFELRNTVVSSTRIKEYIANGRIFEAVAMLGHPYLISTERIPGVKVGSRLGFPTLNFKRPHLQKALPLRGVYAAELEFKGCMQPGALYFGDCPTFEHRTIHFEFHALESGGAFPEPGERAFLWLHSFIRKDRSFPAPEELAAQIVEDVNIIRNFFDKGEARCH